MRQLYCLTNKQGLLVDNENLESFKLAREFFKRRYRGGYKISWYDGIGNRQEKNVRL